MHGNLRLNFIEPEDFCGSHGVLIVTTCGLTTPNMLMSSCACSFNVTILEFGDSSITSSTKSGLLLTLNNGSISISADWKASLLGHGTMLALVDGVKIRVGLLVNADEKGHPHITLTSCFFDVGGFDIKFMPSRFEEKV